jgi:hypothetical protein
MPSNRSAAARTPQNLRKMMISEFCEWLRTRTNKHNRPFQEGTIAAYSDAAIALSGWMGKQKIEKDFTGCDTAVLNRFFRWYYDTYGQSGTNTKQRKPAAPVQLAGGRLRPPPPPHRPTGGRRGW